MARAPSGEKAEVRSGVAAVIPARLESRRFARKVLARETGKFLVQHVYERVVGCPGVDQVLVATDSDEVFDACRSFGAEVVMTSAEHVSGTDRVAEVARDLPHDLIINVQGDEPMIEHGDLETLVGLFPPEERGAAPEDLRDVVVMTTLASRRTDIEGFVDPNIVKVVLAQDHSALYFSRSPVPHDAALAQAEGKAGAGVEWFQHIGLYAYRRDFLLRLAALPASPLEGRERLEQLRVLENGYRIRAGITCSRHLGIDTEEEYRRFVAEYLQLAQRS